MEITAIAMETSRKNKKGKSTGYNGAVIDFESTDNVAKKDLVRLDIPGDNPRFFKVVEFKATSKEAFTVRAVESGYWVKLLSKRADIDIRQFIGMTVVPETDQEVISKNRTESLYC